VAAARLPVLRLGVFAGGVLLAATDVSAHAEASPRGTGWDLAVLLLLLASAAVYAGGVRRAWRTVGRGRGIAPHRVAAFVSGWSVVALARWSPLDALGAERFSLHMLQHELLMVLAAPLLCLARPLVALLWLLPPAARVRALALVRQRAWAGAWGAVSGPAGSWLLHAAVLWLWHLPVAFEAALLHPAWHTLQHASFLAAALLFWWSVLRPLRGVRLGMTLLVLFTTLLHTSALGALLALSSAPWYPAYARQAVESGTDALLDQQLGGLLMWAPGGLAYVAVGLALVGQWIGRGRLSPAGEARPAQTVRPHG
jgi:cytochrome c oxidase assembly factor CtaG